MPSYHAVALTVDGLPALACLSERERRACVEIVGDERRADWRAGRLAAKRAVAQLLDLHDLHSIDLAAPTLSLSVSHVAGRAAAIAAHGPARVGIDLERAGAVRPAQVRYFATAAERRIARRIGNTALWTLKEAAWKALRLGREHPFSALAWQGDADGRPQSVTFAGARHEARVLLGRPWKGFILAAVWLGAAQ